MKDDHGRSGESVRACAGQQEPDSAASAKIRVSVTVVRDASDDESIADREPRTDGSDSRWHAAETPVSLAYALGESETVGAGGGRQRSAGGRETRRRPESNQVQGDSSWRCESTLRSHYSRLRTEIPRWDEHGRESGGKAAGLQSVEDHSADRAAVRPATRIGAIDGDRSISAAQSRFNSEAATAATYPEHDDREHRYATTFGAASQGHRDEHNGREDDASAGEQFGFRARSAAKVPGARGPAAKRHRRRGRGVKIHTLCLHRLSSRTH